MSRDFASSRTPREELPTAFLGGLPKETLQSDIDTLFAGLNKVQVRLVRDKQTDMLRGMAYVVFADRENLEKAIALSGTPVLGKPISIQEANRSSKTEGGASRGPRPAGEGVPQRSREDFPSAFGSSRNGAAAAPGGGRAAGGEFPRSGGRETFTAYIGSLPHEAETKDLDSMFDGLNLLRTRIIVDQETGESKGFGYAEFGDRESLERALVLNGQEWLGHTLKVDVAQKSASAQRGGAGGASRHAGGFQSATAPALSTSSAKAPLTNPDLTGEPINDGKSRPRLQLQKRTIPVEAVPAPAAYSKSNPFGGAKPVDTAAVERKREAEKKAAEEAAAAQAGATPSA